MKVLFAVNNENISETIMRKYQQEYKQIVSSKNVYYFNAIIKELQRDKSYDRIVISEDLEPFSNNNYDAIDNFIFEKMDNISDEATNLSGTDIPIILICADRRTKSEAMLVKLFGIGVYNALLGEDRSVTNVCGLLKKPRTKKEAKIYYKIDTENVDYKVGNEGDVSEVEIQNILNFYKKLGRNEEKYVESFDHIASQYTDSQLRLIAKFLPLNVKAVLEANSTKYQEIVSLGLVKKQDSTKKLSNYQSVNAVKKQDITKKESTNLDLIEKNLSTHKLTKPVVIPTAINTAKIKKVENVKVVNSDMKVEKIDDELKQDNNIDEEKNILKNTEKQDTIIVKKRGRPRKIQPENSDSTQTVEARVKRGRGRPRKVEYKEEDVNTDKNDNVQEDASSSIVNLFELGEDIEETNKKQATTYSDMVLPGLDDEEGVKKEEIIDNKESTVLIKPTSIETEKNVLENFPNFTQNISQSLQNTGKYQLKDVDLSPLLTKEKKIVAFVGTSKNGTSFLVNNLAEIFSQKEIKTALVDLTQNKNAYYIYTENNENLRQIAFCSIEKLKRGESQGIEVNKNLKIFTALPSQNEVCNDYANILETLLKNHSLILLDCDFETNYGYFKESQEIYLVQTLDILTIQPLTAFLRDLKAKNVLSPEKIRIILNKFVKVRSLTEQTVIGGMAYYNDPAMSFMTELFNKDLVPYCSIPFEEQAYSKYLEGLVNCKISLKGYSKNFMSALNKLENMVYPLINNSNFNMQYNNYASNNNKFSNNVNDTLNKMKNSY